MKIEDLEKEIESIKFYNSFEDFEKNFDIENMEIQWILKKVKILKEIQKLEKDSLGIKRKLYEYYKTNYIYSPENFKSLELLINSDDGYKNILSKLNELKAMEALIDEVLKTLRERQWHIKNIIDYWKISKGVV